MDSLQPPRWLLYGFLVVITVLVAVSYTSPSAAPSVTPTPTPEPYDTPTPHPTLQPGENVTVVFQLRSDIDGWEFPSTVSIKRPIENKTDWELVREFRVYEDEMFNVTLTVGKMYQITAEDAEGDRRILGGFVPHERDRSYTLLIGCLCP